MRKLLLFLLTTNSLFAFTDYRNDAIGTLKDRKKCYKFVRNEHELMYVYYKKNVCSFVTDNPQQAVYIKPGSKTELFVDGREVGFYFQSYHLDDPKGLVLYPLESNIIIESSNAYSTVVATTIKVVELMLKSKETISTCESCNENRMRCEERMTRIFREVGATEVPEERIAKMNDEIIERENEIDFLMEELAKKEAELEAERQARRRERAGRDRPEPHWTDDLGDDFDSDPDPIGTSNVSDY